MLDMTNDVRKDDRGMQAIAIQMAKIAVEKYKK